MNQASERRSEKSTDNERRSMPPIQDRMIHSMKNRSQNTERPAFSHERARRDAPRRITA